MRRESRLLCVVVGALQLVLVGCEGGAARDEGKPSAEPSAAVASSPARAKSATTAPASGAAEIPTTRSTPVAATFAGEPEPGVAFDDAMVVFKLRGPGHAVELDLPKGWKATPNFGLRHKGTLRSWSVRSPLAKVVVVLLQHAGHDTVSLDSLAKAWTRQALSLDATWDAPRSTQLGRGGFDAEVRTGRGTRGNEAVELLQFRRMFRPRGEVTHVILAATAADASERRKAELRGFLKSYRMRDD